VRSLFVLLDHIWTKSVVSKNVIAPQSVIYLDWHCLKVLRT